MLLRLSLFLLALPAASLAQDRQPSAASSSASSVPPAVLLEFSPGAAQCDGVAVLPERIEAPFPVIAYGQDPKPAPLSLTFRIDATGRPLGIARAAIAGTGPTTFYYNAQDVIPAFAASRFPAGRAHTQCRIDVLIRSFPVEQAPLSLVRRYMVAPHGRMPYDRALFRRMHPGESDCAETAPKVRLRAFPAFDAIPQPPGTWSYAMAGFDIDRRGKPTGVRIVGSDGNAALDRATLGAVKQSRFAPDAKRGCTYPYYRRSTEPLSAPPAPDAARFTSADARCPKEETAWTAMSPLSFPSGFERRRIEGWAIIGYDVAPWGQTGNVRVLAAEPAAAFGDQARGIVSGARQAPSAVGRSGCVDVVVFVMPKKGHAPTTGEPEGE